MIEHTNEMEKFAKEGTTYMRCFCDIDLDVHESNGIG